MQIPAMFSVMYMCSLVLTALIFLASPTRSLPAPHPRVQAGMGLDALLGLMAETPPEQSDDADSIVRSPTVEQLKERIFRDNMHSPNVPIVLMMALQQHADASGPDAAAELRAMCDGIVAKLAPSVNDTACPWNYTYNGYNENRYPSFNITAQCGSQSCSSCRSTFARGPLSANEAAKEKKPPTVQQCHAVRRPSYFLELNSTTNTWETFAENIVISCQCGD